MRLLRLPSIGHPSLHRFLVHYMPKNRLPKTEWILSNIALEVEFTDDPRLYLITYRLWISEF